VLDKASYRQALLAKLIEEAQEASHATAGGLPGELADVLEVLRALTGRRACPGRNSSPLPTTSAADAAGSEEGSSSNQWNKAAARLNRLPVRRGLHSCRFECGRLIGCGWWSWGQRFM